MSTVTVSTARLASAVAAARAIVVSKSDIAVLQCVLITASNGEMTIAATDLSQGISYRLPCQGQGQWLISFDRMQSFISACNKKQDVTISGVGTANLRCGAVSARIPSLDANDFPDLLSPPSFKGDAHFESRVFVGLLSRLAPLCDRKGRLFEVGVAISASGGKCRMQATTAVVSGWSTITAPPSLSFSSFIAAETCSVIASIFDGVPIWVDGDKSKMWINSDACTYYSKCIDGEPADISSVAANAVNTATVDMAALSAAAKSARSFSEGRSNAVYLSAGGVGSFVGATDGTSSLCVPYDCEGGEFSFTLNAEKFASLIAACGAETASFGLSDGSGLVRVPHIQIVSGDFMGLICGMIEKPAETRLIVNAYLGDTPQQVAA
jgi:DNA polymerase III sliding clamp (beta) subunit (PCNA family)